MNAEEDEHDPATIMAQLERLSRFYSAVRPDTLLPKVAGNDWSFTTIGNAYPCEMLSEDDPPLRIDPRAETIPIDGVLGLYEPSGRAITIFKKGITEVSVFLKCSPDDLQYIVRLHEWGHAFVHTAVTSADCQEMCRDKQREAQILEELTERFQLIERALHEHLAQLLTLTALRHLETRLGPNERREVIRRYIELFETLERHQPGAYRVGRFKDVPQDRLVRSLELLRRGWLAGQLEPWAIVVTW